MARTKQTKRLAKAPAPKLREPCSQRRPVEKTTVAAKQTTSRRPRDSPASPAKSERPTQERVRAESQKASENQANAERTIVSGGVEASAEGKAHADTSSSSAVQTGSRKGVVQTVRSEKKSVSNQQNLDNRHGKRARDSPDDDFTPLKHAVSNTSRSSVLSVSTAIVTTAKLSISNSPVNLPATLPPEVRLLLHSCVSKEPAPLRHNYLMTLMICKRFLRSPWFLAMKSSGRSSPLSIGAPKRVMVAFLKRSEDLDDSY